MNYQASYAGQAFSRGLTLIELVIVIAIVGILMTLAVPNYRSYTQRAHRTEAIRMLLQASICQERVHARLGNYDTGQCQLSSEQQRYKLSYRQPGAVGQAYEIVATPIGAQRSDPCGDLSLNQNGARGIGADNISVLKCWNGR